MKSGPHIFVWQVVYVCVCVDNPCKRIRKIIVNNSQHSSFTLSSGFTAVFQCVTPERYPDGQRLFKLTDSLKGMQTYQSVSPTAIPSTDKCLVKLLCGIYEVKTENPPHCGVLFSDSCF